MQNQPTAHVSQRQIWEGKLRMSRMNFLLIIGFTLINTILLLTQNFTYFLFSAYIPYYLVDMGMALCGLYPPEFYLSVPGFVPFDISVLVILSVFAFLIIVFYLLCWLFTKKARIGWMIAALVVFSLDTVWLLWAVGFNVAILIDVLFHAWIIYELVIGIIACRKLKHLPPDTAIPATDPVDGEFEGDFPTESTPIRTVEAGEKARVLLKTEANGHEIIYRRVKRVNQLVIDGRLYAEIETGLVETAHTLSATVGGHLIVVGFDGFSGSYCTVDGITIAKKARLI